jgi:hypothetical protein
MLRRRWWKHAVHCIQYVLNCFTSAVGANPPIPRNKSPGKLSRRSQSAIFRRFRYLRAAAILTKSLPEKIDWQHAEQRAVKAGRARGGKPREVKGTNA